MLSHVVTSWAGFWKGANPFENKSFLGPVSQTECGRKLGRKSNIRRGIKGKYRGPRSDANRLELEHSVTRVDQS